MIIFQDVGGIIGFDFDEDIIILMNEDCDGFLIDLVVQFVDVVEKFYFNVEVN